MNILGFRDPHEKLPRIRVPILTCQAIRSNRSNPFKFPKKSFDYILTVQQRLFEDFQKKWPQGRLWVFIGPNSRRVRELNPKLSKTFKIKILKSDSRGVVDFFG